MVVDVSRVYYGHWGKKVWSFELQGIRENTCISKKERYFHGEESGDEAAEIEG